MAFTFSDPSAWRRALYGLGGGLMARSQGAPFSAGLMQGFQNYDAGQQADLQRRMEEERLRLLQEEADARRTAASKKAEFANKISAMLNPGMGAPNNGRPGGMAQQSQDQLGGLNIPPQLRSILGEAAQYDPEGAYATLMKFATDKPDAGKWQITTVREGNQDVTYRINPMTGEREKLGAGAAFAPKDSSGGNLSIAAPVWGTDAQGNPVLLQMSPTGTAFQTILPQGVTPIRPNVQVDTGTGTAMVSPITGQAATVIPKDVAGKQAQEEIGTATGKVASGLPDAEAKASEALQLIDTLKKHPGRGQATGMSSVIPLIPGTDAYDFNVSLDQLKGTVFLQAYSQLRGGGAITEIEGQKAEQAIARLNRAQSEGEFMKALDELSGVISSGLDRMRKRAGSAAPAGSVPPPPPGFQVVP